MFPLELLDEMLNKNVVEILTTKVRVSCSSLNFKNTVVNCKERYIKSSSTQIEDQHIFLFIIRVSTFLIQSIRNSSCSWLIDNPQNIQPRDSASVFGCLSLRVIEVC